MLLSVVGSVGLVLLQRVSLQSVGAKVCPSPSPLCRIPGYLVAITHVGGGGGRELSFVNVSAPLAASGVALFDNGLICRERFSPVISQPGPLLCESAFLSEAQRPRGMRKVLC